VIAIPRASLPAGAWDAFVGAHPRGRFWQTSHWVEYCLRYTPGSTDHSVALADNHDQDPITLPLVGVVPLVREGQAFSMGGLGCPVPLLSPEVHPTQAARLVRGMATAQDVAVWSLRGYDDDAAVAAVSGDHASTHHLMRWPSYFVDVAADAGVMWSRLRRSYHSLIHKAERTYDLLVDAHPAAVQVAHRVHAASAGRETRPQATWDLMEEWGARGLALVALAVPPGGVIADARGMALAIQYKDWAYYASGATLDDNVSHALIWQLMLALHCRGVATFEVGWGEREGDSPKERSIAFFKSGFGGTAAPVFRVEEPV
jgi:hypothetical protein